MKKTVTNADAEANEIKARITNLAQRQGAGHTTQHQAIVTGSNLTALICLPPLKWFEMQGLNKGARHRRNGRHCWALNLLSVSHRSSRNGSVEVGGVSGA